MTLAEIKASSELTLTPDQVAPVLKCNPHLIRLQARESPQLLGFPVIVVGNRTKIPRKPFLAFLGEGPPEDENTPFPEEGGECT